MATRLTFCSSCRRQLRVGESSCPSCEGVVPVDVPERADNLFVGPLTRAALVFGSVAAMACSRAGAPITLSGGPTIESPPPCAGKVYVSLVDAGGVHGYLVCEDGVWVFQTAAPADAGYTIYTGACGASDGGDAGSCATDARPPPG